jgi:magnesium-transporting ATPase (P-type)
MFSEFTVKTKEEILKVLETTELGLTSNEAVLALEKHGPNTLPGKNENWIDILLRQFQSPFVYLLGAATIITFFLREYIDSTMIVLFVFINIILGFI